MANCASFRQMRQSMGTYYDESEIQNMREWHYVSPAHVDKYWRERHHPRSLGQDGYRVTAIEKFWNGLKRSATLTWTSSMTLLHRYRGILWAIFCILTATSCSLCVKLLTGSVPPSQLIFFRGIFQILFAAPCIVFFKHPLRYPPKSVMLITVRGIIGTFLSFLCYYSYQAIPVATAKALIYSSPVLVAIFAGVFLKEKCSLGTTFFSFLTVVSVVLVVQPPFIFGSRGDTASSIVGLMCSSAGAFTVAVNVIILRYIQMRRINAHVIVFAYGVIAAVCCAIFPATGLERWTNPGCSSKRRIIILMCLSGFLEQVSGTLALKTEKASVISVLRGNDVIVSFVFEFFIFHTLPGAWTVVGIFGVVGSAIGMTVSSHFASERDKKRETKDKHHTISDTNYHDCDTKMEV
ncbi:solute carrier family 35 member G1-like [Lytechinus variegatus]|uniref:solute carrier family 35 member G1-like n=1 Tax=Lytechinus variegatus TaxID=7654 RepID=UPI001BB117FD|nr:solute carrier family 35 member G1-like [Lytechinus variegatus]